MNRSVCNRADLVRVMNSQDLLVPFAAEMLGFAKANKRSVEAEIPDAEENNATTIESSISSTIPTRLKETSDWPKSQKPALFWTANALEQRQPLPNEVHRDGELIWRDRPAEGPRWHPISEWQSLVPRLRAELSKTSRSSRVDVDKVVRMLAAGQLVHDVPRQVVRRWGDRVQIVFDRCEHLIPYRQDQAYFLKCIKNLLPRAAVQVALFDSTRQSLRMQNNERPTSPYVFPPVGVPIVLLSDLGALCPAASQEFWRGWVAELIQRDGHALAVVPCSPERVRQEIRAAIQVISWQKLALARSCTDERTRRQLVDRLFQMLSPAERIEPGLLRAVRHTIQEAADASLESEFWQDARLGSPHPKAASLRRDPDQRDLLPDFRKLPLNEREAVLDILRRWRQPLDPEVWIREIWGLDAESLGLVPSRDREDAESWQSILMARTAGSASDAMLAWLARATAGLPEIALQEKRSLRDLHRRVHQHENLLGGDPRELGKGDSVWEVTVGQTGGSLVFTDTIYTKSRSTFQSLGRLQTTNGSLTVELDAEAGDQFWLSGEPPSWASDWGWDVHGAWAEFEISNTTVQVGAATETNTSDLTDLIAEQVGLTRLKTREIVERVFNLIVDQLVEEGRIELRGFGIFEIRRRTARKARNPRTGERVDVPAKHVVTFQPGKSVEDQLERMPSDSDPVLEHQVIRQTVRQRMRWIPPGRFTMGSPDDEQGHYSDEGPLHEVTISRGFWIFDTPVTQDLWQVLMGENPSQYKSAKNPVESVSWEDTQKFLKRLNEKLGEAVFSLPTEAQWEYACRARSTTRYAFGDELTEKQARFNASDGTTEVCSFDPNRWGLYDTHGNVWEWCQDWFGKYPAGAQIDPVGPSEGPYRVLRGGAWYVNAQFVRSAYRFYSGPGVRDRSIGFRCAQVQEGAEPTREDGMAAEPTASPTGGGEAVALKIDSGTTSAIALPGAPAVILRSDLDSLTLKSITRPTWANAIGRDRYGLWADLSLDQDNHPAGPVIQRLRWIPPGRFMMGSADDDELGYDAEKPQHLVLIGQGFWLFDTPVTQEFWQVVMEENPSHYQGTFRPVENISWYDCQQFLDRVNEKVEGLEVHLPTEAQWEYACRAGSTTRYSFGDEILSDRANYSRGRDGEETTVVKTFSPNDWGVYDMHGNVWEWCQDYWAVDYTDADVTDPIGPNEGQRRVLRGGAWADDAQALRSAFRGHADPELRNYSSGFRCVQIRSDS